MTVFKGYMKIIGQNRMLILLYVAIFSDVRFCFSPQRESQKQVIRRKS